MTKFCKKEIEEKQTVFAYDNQTGVWANTVHKQG